MSLVGFARNISRTPTIRFMMRGNVGSQVMLARALSSFPQHEVLIMPALSPTMERGNLARWALKVGDVIEAGTVICEIETDKATVDYEAQDDGYLAKILVNEGATEIDVGVAIGITVDDKDDIAAFENFTVDDLEGDAAPAAAPAPKEPETVTAPPSVAVEPPAPTPAAEPVQQPTAAPPAPVAAPPAPKPAASAPVPRPVVQARQSPLSKSLELRRAAYEAEFGRTFTNVYVHKEERV